MTNRDIAIEYIAAFCSGDLAALSATLHEDFSLQGPLFKFDRKSDYLESLADDVQVPGRYDVIEVVGAADKVSVYYSYEKPSGTVVISQLFWFRDGKISKTLLVFDPECAV